MPSSKSAQDTSNSASAGSLGLSRSELRESGLQGIAASIPTSATEQERKNLAPASRISELSDGTNKDPIAHTSKVLSDESKSKATPLVTDLDSYVAVSDAFAKHKLNAISSIGTANKTILETPLAVEYPFEIPFAYRIFGLNNRIARLEELQTKGPEVYKNFRGDSEMPIDQEIKELQQEKAGWSRLLNYHRKLVNDGIAHPSESAELGGVPLSYARDYQEVNAGKTLLNKRFDMLSEVKVAGKPAYRNHKTLELIPAELVEGSQCYFHVGTYSVSKAGKNSSPVRDEVTMNYPSPDFESAAKFFAESGGAPKSTRVIRNLIEGIDPPQAIARNNQLRQALGIGDPQSHQDSSGMIEQWRSAGLLRN